MVKSKDVFYHGDIMLQETIRLEKLRQQIEDAEYQSGSTSDYLDRGKPGVQQARTAGESIVRTDTRSRELKSELHEIITTTRTNKPEAFEEWINLHKNILQRILTEKVSDSNARVRQNVARGTLQEWDKVLTGEQEYIGINWHYLKDYKAEVRKLVKRNNAWWKFW